MDNKLDNGLIYADLSYKIIGCLFDVFDELGYGHKEKYYENALVELFKEKGLKYERQLYTPLMFMNKNVGKYYFDFLIDGRLVLELHQAKRFSKKHIDQIYSYLKAQNLKLGLLAHFTPDGVIFKRIVNLY